MSKAISGHRLGRALVEAGILPPNANRCVIDITADLGVKIYVQLVGSRQLLDFDWAAFLRGAPVRVTEAASATEQS